MLIQEPIDGNTKVIFKCLNGEHFSHGP